MQEEHDTIVQAFMWGTLAGAGGMVKYISSVIRSSTPITQRRFWMLLAANSFISSFCGLIGGLLVRTMSTDPIWQLLAAGIFGYLGTTSLDFAIIALKRKVNPDLPLSAVMPVPAQVVAEAEKQV